MYKQPLQLHVYSDPGHAWLKVRKSQANKASVYMGEKISSFSYQRGEFVFLEEDCDLGIYVRYLEAIKRPYKFVEHHTDKSSKIRGYQNYSFEEIKR
jgi:hypothetical protein